ncbi:class I adenylate-forming enzyme family protein [Paenibacillus sp. Z6-24]
MLTAQMKCQIISVDGRSSREQLEQDATGLSRLLSLRGFSSDSRVILKSANSYWFIAALFALCHKAVSLVVVDPQIGRDELLHIHGETEANLLLTDTDLMLPGMETILLSELADSLAVQRRMEIQSPQESLDLDAWCARRDALILYSSGTTGKPKGIVKAGQLFMDNIVHSIRAMGYQPTDCMLPVVPYSHFYGISLIFSWWLTACSLIVCNPQNLRSVITNIIRERATIVDANPSAFYTMLRMLARKPRQLEALQNAPVRMWCVGGSPLTRDLEEKFDALFHKPLLNGYGLSELGNVTLGTLGNPHGCGAPLPGIQIKVLDSLGNPLPDQEIGEVWIQTPGCMEGYLHRPDLTEAAVHNGWFRTGDMGCTDNGNLHVVGRTGKTVNRMGYLVSPAYIESRISLLGCRSCVIALDDELKGSLLIAFIEEEAALTLAELRKEMNQILPTYMYPDLLIPLPGFPLNRNGKVDRLELEKLAITKTTERSVRKSAETLV